MDNFKNFQRLIPLIILFPPAPPVGHLNLIRESLILLNVENYIP
jgi:hypothetical protein